MRCIGILGGTFDPIHYGHLRLALEAQQQLALDQVRLIPLNIPPHRSNPFVSAIHRRKMVELAVVEQENLDIDLRELDNDDISYTINTLKALRQDYKDDTLFLIVGRDAFNQIDSWKDWDQLLNYTHIIVANRPGEETSLSSKKLTEWTKEHQTNDVNLLKNNKNGFICFIDIPMLDISSSMIRELLKQSKSISDLLPSSVFSYIEDNHLYTDTA